jgi:hypothetical protein
MNDALGRVQPLNDTLSYPQFGGTNVKDRATNARPKEFCRKNIGKD